jgi:ATP-binding cassette subfamily B protein
VGEKAPSRWADIGDYRRLLGYLRPYTWQILFAYGGMVAVTILNLIVPQIIKGAIDEGLAANNVRALFVAGAIIVGIAAVRGLAGYAQRYYGEWLSHRVGYDLRNDFYNSVQYQPFAAHDQSHTGDLMSRATGDTAETERFVGIGLADLLATVILLVGVVVVMLWEEPRLALIALMPFPLLIYLTLRFGLRIRPLFKRIHAS